MNLPQNKQAIHSANHALSRLYSWVVHHDDSKWFAYIYTSSAVVLSLWLGLFWLCLIVVAHFVLELVKQYYKHRNVWLTMKRSLWELKLDLVLILFAFVVVLYTDTIFGLAGLGAAARTGAQASARIGTRAGIWQRAIRGTLMSIDDVARIAGKLAMRPWKVRSVAAKHECDNVQRVRDSQANTAKSSENSHDDTPNRSKKWTRGDQFTIVFGALCMALLVAAPYVTATGMRQTFTIIIHELHPFPR